ncbi:hypothetical protein CC78DRAFT_138169 [Lojkania enalia]|uniref:Secreted protein n=1 Tax=Lojkania enalia TaxID=147567 RepID=A0A9P4TR67_9PLEO|nr:hypothetical protein CC78DRAFT_138169 [Didymosphaeria enalia]
MFSVRISSRFPSRIIKAAIVVTVVLSMLPVEANPMTWHVACSIKPEAEANGSRHKVRPREPKHLNTMTSMRPMRSTTAEDRSGTLSAETVIV